MAKNVKQHVPVFVSSTKRDLIPYRKAVWDTLDKLKVAVRGMEVFGARSEEPLETCLEEVSQSQVFIGILAMKHGSIDEETGKSFVQLEYEKAMEESLDILIYLIDEENTEIAPKFMDTDESATKLRHFKELLRKKHTIDRFLSPEDLAIKVQRDLLRLFEEKDLIIEEERLQPSVEPERTKELLRKFDLMPERFAGSEIELIVEFSEPPSSIPERVCKAIGLPIGASLSRSITILHPPDVPTEYYFLRDLYAEYDGCDFLYDAPADKEFKLTARLAFGEQRKIVRQPGPFELRIAWFGRPPVIKDLETGEVFENYITHSRVKAIIFVKTIGSFA